MMRKQEKCKEERKQSSTLANIQRIKTIKYKKKQVSSDAWSSEVSTGFLCGLYICASVLDFLVNNMQMKKEFWVLGLERWGGEDSRVHKAEAMW